MLGLLVSQAGGIPFPRGPGGVYKQRSPETNLKASENGGYLRIRQSRALTDDSVVIGALDTSASPHHGRAASGAPKGRRVGSIASYTKSPSS